MAKLKINMPDEFISKISELGKRTDEVFEDALESAADIVYRRMKSNLDSVIGSGVIYDSRRTGELQRSLGVTSVKLDKNGNYNIKIGFAEPRKNGESNAKIASIIEYGKHGQPAKPFLKPTKSSTKAAAETAMKNKLEEEFKKL